MYDDRYFGSRTEQDAWESREALRTKVDPRIADMSLVARSRRWEVSPVIADEADLFMRRPIAESFDADEANDLARDLRIEE